MQSHSPTHVLVTVAITLLAAAERIGAQGYGWSTLRESVAYSSAAAHDLGRQRMVVVDAFVPSATKSWELDGTDPSASWRRLDWPLVTARSSVAMVYDDGRRELVLFDGSSTWCSGGAGWQLRTPAVTPPVRSAGALCYDSTRGVVVLFGGWSSTYLDDTWEWNGITWQQAATAVRPPARSDALMAYDPQRQRVVLTGGYGPPSDTWEWDGASWQLRAATSPYSGVGSALAWFGPRGRVTSHGWNGTWEWDGMVWTQRDAGNTILGPMCYVPEQQRLLQCRANGGAATPSTKAWNGTQWTAHGAASISVSPGPRSEPGLATDWARGNVVLFGGWSSNLAYVNVFNDTWVFEQRRWQRRLPATSPSARRRAAMAYHPSTQQVVLFGGGDPQLLNDTWTWDGANWTQRQPANSPSPRESAGMATDALRDRVVLFGGGAGFGQALGDTWEWDGSTWLQRFPAQSPPAHEAPVMAEHTASQRVVLARTTTWTYDGANWLYAGPSPFPSGGSMANDPDRGVLVWSSGNATWQWNGTAWTLAAAIHGPFAPMTFDPFLRRCVAVSTLSSLTSNLTHFFGPAGQEGATVGLGTGCPGSTAPQLTSNVPWLLESRLAVDIVGAAPLALCAFAMSLQQQPLAIGGGCWLYPDNPVLHLDVTNAAGFASFGLHLPVGLPLGVSVFAQGAALDAAAPLGLALTAGRRIHVGL